MRAVTSLAVVVLLLAAPGVSAREVEGVQIPETLTVAGAPLTLNGAGVRKRFFIKVYVGALYLSAKQTQPEAIVNADGAKSVYLHILYKELEASKLTDAWTDGFKNNSSETEFQALAPRLAQFNASFRAVRRGDTIRLDFLPNSETRVVINDEDRGTVSGADFQRAVLKVWLGDKPADGDLKQAMLGG